jgi:hypothetical protein
MLEKTEGHSKMGNLETQGEIDQSETRMACGGHVY